MYGLKPVPFLFIFDLSRPINKAIVRKGVSQKRVIIGKFPQEMFIFLPRGVVFSNRSRMAVDLRLEIP